MKTWRRFWRMSSYGRGQILEAAGGLLITRAALALAGYRRWKAAIEWLTPGADAAGDNFAGAEIDFARAIERWQSAAARHLPVKTNCLDRALALWWMLRRRGVAAELCIGARKAYGRFEAHAWVEVGDAAIDDGNGSEEFAEFAAPVQVFGIGAS
jgi:hypothetical protein